jgi:hypothetical protein
VRDGTCRCVEFEVRVCLVIGVGGGGTDSRTLHSSRIINKMSVCVSADDLPDVSSPDEAWRLTERECSSSTRCVQQRPVKVCVGDKVLAKIRKSSLL